MVTTDGLPYPVSIIGTNLRPAVTLSLNDEAALPVSGIEVHLNGISAPILEHADSTRLRVMLPKTLTMGTYDVTVTLGPSHSVVLAGGLRVMRDTSSTSSDAASTDSAESSTSATNSASSDDSKPTSAASSRDSSSDVESSSAALDTSPTGPDQSSAISNPSDATSDVLDAGLTGISDDASTADTSSDDRSTQPTPAISYRCAPHEFGPPEKVNVPGSLGTWIWSPTLSQDGKTMFFTDSTSTEVLLMATRTERTADFSPMTIPPSPRPQGDVGTPFLSQSELSLYFHSTHNGPANRELYVATRASVSDSFGNAKQLARLNAPNVDHLPWVSPDELTIVYVSSRNGTAYLTSTRPTINDDFSPPVAFNLPGTGRIFITANGLRAYFVARDRPGGYGHDDIWFATRESTSEEFSNITNLHAVNGGASDTDVTLTADGEELFFIRAEANRSSIYRSVANCDAPPL